MTTALPPGPRTPRAWQTYRYLSKPKEYTRHLTARFGPVTRIRMLQGSGVTVASPELARTVFATDPSKFEAFRSLTTLFGSRAVIATAGDEHRRQRKLLNPRFHGARMKAFFSVMAEIVERHLAAVTPGTELRMADLTQEITFDIILETVFGGGAALERPRATAVLHGLVKTFVPSLLAFPWLSGTIFPPWRRYLAARKAFDDLVDEIVAERRKSELLGEDILGMLLEARYEDGSPLDPAELRDHLFTLLAAGHETTAVALAWGVYFLATNPTSLARLRTELATLGPSPAPEALLKQPFLEAVCAESLRVEPIVTDIVRVCKEPVQVGEWTVPKGEALVVLIGTILGDATIYEEPDRFRPERFLERKPAANEFLPFGGGSRRCLGAAFAEAELAIGLGTIAARYDFELVSPAPERSVRRNITMGPEHGVRVRMAGRRAP